MKIGIILQSNNPEHVWNTFRFGITSLKASHDVTIFLMSEGSELDTVADTEHFDISKKLAEYKELKGNLYACGSCLEIRGLLAPRLRQTGKKEVGVCPVSTMTDLLKMVEESDKVLVFG